MELNEDNLQFLEEAMNHYSDGDYNDTQLNSKQNSSIKPTEVTIASSVFNNNKEIMSLQKELKEKNDIILDAQLTNSKLQSENMRLKNQMIQQSNDNSKLTNGLNTLKEQYNKLFIETKEVKEKMIQLNYDTLQLQQKIMPTQDSTCYSDDNHIYKLKESFLEKEQTYEVEISRLANQIEELEIFKSKLLFDNKTLHFKLSDTEEDKASELNLLQSIKDNEINNHKQTINSLNHQIVLLNKSLRNKSNTHSTNNIFNNDYYINQINDLEQRIKDLNDENYELKKENQVHINNVTDSQIRIENKDKIIDKLQNDFEKLINEYKGKIKEFNDDVNQALSSDDLLTQIDHLTQEKEELIMKNEQLENGLIELNKNIKNANALFNSKYAEFEYELEKERNKNKGYKKRISNLKLKIDQLYEENAVKKIEYKKPGYSHHIHKKSVDYLNTEPASIYVSNASHMNNNHNNLKMMTMSPNKNSIIIPSSNSNSNNNNNIGDCSQVYHKNLDDPYYNNQQKTLDNYRKTLEKIDTNLRKIV